MRHLILLLIATTLSCAEWSQLTLRDGRVLVGRYDVAAQILDMGCAQIAIPPADIASVSPATRPATKRAAVVEPTQKAADLVRLRAEADAAATAYAAATLAYYQAAYAGAPRPVAMAPSDGMTMAEHRAASAAQCLPEAWDQLGNAIATLVKHAASPAPVTRAIRAAQFDYALTFGGDSAARRKLLGMPEPKD